jgi:hypothetical protein
MSLLSHSAFPSFRLARQISTPWEHKYTSISANRATEKSRDEAKADGLVHPDSESRISACAALFV